MPKIVIISSITTERNKITLLKAEKFRFRPQTLKVLKCLRSFKLHYVQLHYVKIQAGSFVIWLKSCSSQSTQRETLAVRENENRAEQAAGSLHLNLKSFEGCCACLSQTTDLSSKTPRLSLAAGEQPSFVLLHRDSPILESYLGSY